MPHSTPSSVPACALFCVVVGFDGSGKSSLLSRVRTERPTWSVVSPSPQDLYPTPGLEFMNWALKTHPKEFASSMRPLSRSLLLMKTVAILHEYHIVPALSSGKVVVCDSYYYRLCAKELILNPLAGDLFLSLVPHLKRPDLVVWLDVDVATAYRRKNKVVSPFEYIDSPTEHGFGLLQERVGTVVADLIRSVPVVHVDGRLELDACAQLVVQIIEQHSRQAEDDRSTIPRVA